ncbi:Histidine kinase [Salegentibacter holothuriorum]|uniref:Histidine kinase n=1 Tax=Salegentibacter holothuriorum TaxID=241145 RepID=A0A1T5DFN9_9FLAO|nr:histidine kinase [Salegentibacter holothuriorum]SKB70522.1 Histidine kinase [Salegentibacter holothuriorum]
MKKILLSLILLSLVSIGFSQEKEKLPLQPWKDILEINSTDTPISKWVKDIKVGMEGNYTKADSLNVAKAVKKLDSITQTISIKFTNNIDANLRIHFLDTIVKEEGNSLIVNMHYDRNSGAGYAGADVYIYRIDKSDAEVQNTIESRLAKTLVSGSFYYHISQRKRNSIFNPIIGQSNSSVPLNKKDMAIIEAVYGKYYEERLNIAEKQFESVVKNIENEKIDQRNRSIWWVRNPISVLILPGIILLLVFAFLIKKINQTISSKIENDWLHFGVIVFVALIFTNVLIILFVSFYDFMTIPNIYRSEPLIRKNTIISTTLLLYLLVYPFLFLLRYLEIKISKSSQQNLIKTSLIFLSTAFLPFLILLIILYFTSGIDANRDYYNLSKAFLFIIAFASIRAFISYFIFKERSLIVQNEMQLSELRELKTKAELNSLHSRINPHFLYNALNSIASLAHKNADKTEKMALSLSDLFKYTINRKGRKDSTIGDEVEMVQNYLEVEQIRFDDRLNFTIDVDKTLENTKIPMFLIQPLIENSVKHGISKVENNGQIRLSIQKNEIGFTIIAEDNGPDFPEGLVSGHGLQTVFDLLRLTYGDKASISWKNTPTKHIKITIEN